MIPERDYAKPRPPAGITVGPLARSVRDAALVTQVMASPDGRDPFSIQTEQDDFLADIDKGVKGMRFAWTDDFGFAQRYAAPHSARGIALFRAEATKMVSLGVSVEEAKAVWDKIMPGHYAPWTPF